MTRGLRTLFALAALLGALVFAATGQAQTSCSSALLQDWRDGRIDGTYPVACYRTALSQLPEDLRIYSSAESDIKRALLARSQATLAAPAKAKKPKTVGEISPARVSRSDDAVKQGGARPAGSGSPRRAKCIVSKWIGPPYVSGRTRAWLKTKNPNFER